MDAARGGREKHALTSTPARTWKRRWSLSAEQVRGGGMRVDPWRLTTTPGLKTRVRGAFGISMPLLEALGLALTHDAKNNRMCQP